MRALSALLSGLLLAAAFPSGAWAQLAAARAAAAAPISAPVRAVPAALRPVGLSGGTLSLPGAPSLSPSLPTPSAVAPRVVAPLASAALPAAGAYAVPVAAALPTPSLAPPRAKSLPSFADVAAERPAAAVPAAARAAVKTRFAELRAAFGLRSPGPDAVPVLEARGFDSPKLSRPAAALAEPEGAVPAPAPIPRGWLGFGSVLTFFLAAMAVEQIGNETQSAGLPPLIAKVFGDVSISAEMGIWSSLADFAGAIMAPFAIRLLGLKGAFLGSAAARLLSGALVAGFLAVGHMTVPSLMAATVVGAFFYGMNYTVEKAIPAIILEQDRASLERFKAARQFVIEVVATAVPILTGLAVASWGFLPALAAFPVAAGAAMLIVALTLKIPAKAAAVLASDVHTPAGGLAGFWRSLTRGAVITWTRPDLRDAFWAYSFFYIMTPLLYWIVGPAYALLVAGPGAEEAATLIAGVMFGFFSLGGLGASLLIMREHRGLEGLDAAAKHRALGASLTRWMTWGSVSLIAIAAMALPLPAWGPMTLAALALLPFGLAQVMAKLKAESYFQSQAPADAVDDATAFMEGASMLVGMAALYGAKLAFSTLTGWAPFVVLAAAMIPFAALCLWVTRRLAQRQNPE
ncbi:MAG: hypothetical protein HYZ75_16125 [Elusimicrobia bacterium]|nr:hypothetical protein [Elusimicrobiota bacterium]